MFSVTVSLHNSYKCVKCISFIIKHLEICSVYIYVHMSRQSLFFSAFCWHSAVLLGVLWSPTVQRNNVKQATAALTWPIANASFTLWYLTYRPGYQLVRCLQLFGCRSVFFFMYYGLHGQPVALLPSAAGRSVCINVRRPVRPDTLSCVQIGSPETAYDRASFTVNTVCVFVGVCVLYYH